VSGRIVEVFDRELRQGFGITGRDYELLHHLSEAPGGVRVGALAEVISDSSSCITHRTKRLAARGLVDKRADPDDQRARVVVLTRAGRGLLQRAAPAHLERVRRYVISGLGERDQRDLARVMGRLREHLRTVTGDGLAEA
jgi:DNA-binding MarR family transcriptional regulator